MWRFFNCVALLAIYSIGLLWHLLLCLALNKSARSFDSFHLYFGDDFHRNIVHSWKRLNWMLVCCKSQFVWSNRSGCVVIKLFCCHFEHFPINYGNHLELWVIDQECTWPFFLRFFNVQSIRGIFVRFPFNNITINVCDSKEFFRYFLSLPFDSSFRLFFNLCHSHSLSLALIIISIFQTFKMINLTC